MLREKMLMPLVYGTDAAQESSTVGLMLCVKMCRVGGPSSMVSGGRDGQPPSAPQ